jgi:hypothetical protein
VATVAVRRERFMMSSFKCQRVQKCLVE